MLADYQGLWRDVDEWVVMTPEMCVRGLSVGSFHYLRRSLLIFPSEVDGVLIIVRKCSFDIFSRVFSCFHS